MKLTYNGQRNVSNSKGHPPASEKVGFFRVSNAGLPECEL